MKYFPEIIRILNQFREPRIETVDSGFRQRKHDKTFLLYEGIREGLYKNDDQAAVQLYGSGSTDTRYSTLKSRLRSRLINSLFHLNLRKAGYSEFGQAIYTCHKRSFLVHTLLTLGARGVAMRIAEKTLQQAEKYYFTAVALDMVLLLRTHSALLAASTKYEHLDRKLKKLLDTLSAECKSWEYFERAQSILSQRSGGTQEFGETLDGYVAELEPLLSTTDSSTFSLNYYRLVVLSHSAMGRHRLKVDACNAAILYLESVPQIASRSRLAEFSLQKLESYIVTRDYENGVEAAKQCSNLISSGLNSWFGYAEYYFFLLMHTEHFIEAEAHFIEVTSNPRFSTLPELWKERWKIFELYLHYALRSLPDYDSQPLRKNFDLQAFLRFVPTAAKDKHGMSIAVLIIHILYLLEAKDFNGIIDRMDSLRTYRSRYLRIPSNHRSSLFFKLLTVMENNSFSYKLTRAKSDRYFKLLLQASAEEAETNDELLVIPYEWLWQRVLDKLREFELDYSKK